MSSKFEILINQLGISDQLRRDTALIDARIECVVVHKISKIWEFHFVFSNILPIETIAGEERMIGNIIIKSQEFGEIIGYENHSGQTFLDKTVTPLGQVIKGAGNNMIDASEGVRYNNVIATYLHGPILPKNPQIADFLINETLRRRGISIDPETDKIDDSLANESREISLKLPR